MMKNRRYKILFGIYVFLLACCCNAQVQIEGTDLGLLSIRPVIPVQIDGIPASAASQLRNKLRQIVLNNGVNGAILSEQFILTVSIDLISKDELDISPPMTLVNLGLNFYIADYESTSIFSTATIEIKGSGLDTEKAYIKAIRNINAKHKAFAEMMNTGKQKIISYYNKRCDIIIQKAQVFSNANKYGAAICKLLEIPEACTGCHKKAWDEINKIYQQYIDDECQKYLTKAKTIWAASPNYQGAEEAGKWLSYIEPGAYCYEDAISFVEAMKKKVMADENREWGFLMKVYDSAVDIQQKRIEAARAVGVAFGQGQPDINYNLKEIFR